jgi:hypothetical protein
MQSWWPERWSGGAQLLCDGLPGSAFSLLVHVPAAGDYELSAYTTLAPDYGLLRVTVDGEPLGEPLDGYAPIVAPSGRRTLGRPWLDSGEHRVRFEVIDRHPSSTGHLIGVDCLELIPLHDVPR